MEQEEIEQLILEVTGAQSLFPLGVVQSLWSGYGSIERIGLEGARVPSVIVKHVQPATGNHPRGWNTGLSHQRKLKSYQVERYWYENQGAQSVNGLVRIPNCFGTKIFLGPKFHGTKIFSETLIYYGTKLFVTQILRDPNFFGT